MVKNKLKDEVKRYLEYELKHYDENNKILEEIKSDIIDGAPSIELGMPSAHNVSDNSIINKVDKLMSNIQINRIVKVNSAIDRVVKELNPDLKSFYNLYYKQKLNRIATMNKCGISDRSFTRYRNKIIYSLADELGY